MKLHLLFLTNVVKNRYILLRNKNIYIHCCLEFQATFHSKKEDFLMCATNVQHDVKKFEEYVSKICLLHRNLFSDSYKLSCIFQNPNKWLNLNLLKEYRNFFLLINEDPFNCKQVV